MIPEDPDDDADLKIDLKGGYNRRSQGELV